MKEAAFGFLFLCVAVGGLAALRGAWDQVRIHRAQLEVQSDAFELDRGQASRDLQRALLCVPQSVHQTIRIELELLGLRQAERWKELLREQHRWQGEQDALRQAEWQALLSSISQLKGASPAVVVPPVRPAPVPAARLPASRPMPAPPSPRPPELPETPRPQPVAADIAKESERQLSDEEIDALPPDLPAPSRLSGRKLPAPKGPVLRNI
jgi:hypothetical protein